MQGTDKPSRGDETAIKAAWAAANVFPLWENRAAHAPPKPAEPACHWRWSDLGPFVRQAIGMRDMAAVERRVLMLVSPHAAPVGGAGGTTTNLNANVQILMPGETARPHRHSMNALRFVMQGEDAVTIVDGKECPMAEGDLVTTPGWCWHEHVHRGTAPIVWLDVLDASLHRYLGTARFQPGPSNDMPRRTDDSAFAAAGFTPQISDPAGNYSPMFRYPWEQAKAAVAAAPIGPDGARRVRYANPLDGGPCMPFLDCYLVEIDAKTPTVPFRTSAHAVCTVVEGSGTSRVGEDEIAWGPRDVFSMPHGNWISHRASGGKARLFIVTDRDIFRRLDLLSEEYEGQA
jgi:gentisate 1,2-dioxygenase